MVLTIVQHRVKDFDVWQKGYKETADLQKQGGVLRESAYQAKGDPNNVLVLHYFASMEAAEAFVNSPALREAMQQLGVDGMPRIEFYEEV